MDTVHVPSVRGHVTELKETDPGATRFQLTLPLGRNPVTLAVQVMIVGEPKAADFAHETVVLVGFIVTTMVDVPVEGRFLKSPPYLAASVTGDPVLVGVNSTEQ